MRELVAIDLEGGPAFVDALRRTWDHGDAVLPIDARLPRPARAAILAAARPHVLVGDGGTRPERTTLDGGAPLVPHGAALVIASSGTTGEPKVLVHTHDAVRAHAHAVHARLGVDRDRDRWLACLPLAHLGGLGVVLRSLVTDTPVDVWPRFDAGRVGAAPRELGATLVALVPTALDRTDGSGFRCVVVGGAADPARRPPNVVRTYGLTETGGGVVYDGTPLPGVEVRIGAGGEIELRGPMLAAGRRRPDGSVEPVVDPSGWFATGDLGRWSPEGRLHVDGRADDLIVTGGENVWPAPVEAALTSHPGVADAAVVGRPDPDWGQRVVAFVVPVDPDRPPALGALRDHVRATLPASAAPRELVTVAALPRTALGKVRRRDLAP